MHPPNACLCISPDVELVLFPRDENGDDDDGANILYRILLKLTLLQFHAFVDLEKYCTQSVG